MKPRKDTRHRRCTASRARRHMTTASRFGGADTRCLLREEVLLHAILRATNPPPSTASEGRQECPPHQDKSRHFEAIGVGSALRTIPPFNVEPPEDDRASEPGRQRSPPER